MTEAPNNEGPTNALAEIDWTRVKVTLVSSVPMLQDRPDEKTVAALQAGTTSRATKGGQQDLPEEICKRKLYLGEDGSLGIPTRNLWASLCTAGKLVKFDAKRQMSSSSGGTLLPIFLEIEGGEHLPFKSHSPWEVNTGTGRNQTGAMVITTRPLIKEWSLEIEIAVDELECDLERIQMLFRYAGCGGIGTYRPSKSLTGYYGRFRLAGFEIVHQGATATKKGKGAKGGNGKAEDAEELVAVGAGAEGVEVEGEY